MGSSPVGVKCTFNYHFPCVYVLCLPFQNVYAYFLGTPFLYSLHRQPFSFWSSSFCFSFHLPEQHSFTSQLSSFLQMCPNKFNFLSLILCMTLILLHKILFYFFTRDFLHSINITVFTIQYIILVKRLCLAKLCR